MGGNSVKKRYEWKREHVGESGPLSAACGAKKGHNNRLPACLAWANLSLRETEIPSIFVRHVGPTTALPVLPDFTGFFSLPLISK